MVIIYLQLVTRPSYDINKASIVEITYAFCLFGHSTWQPIGAWAARMAAWSHFTEADRRSLSGRPNPEAYEGTQCSTPTTGFIYPAARGGQ